MVSLEMERRIRQAALRTWDVIAPDCLVNENGEPDESATMTKDEVIEMVIDADRLAQYGGDPQAADVFYNRMSWEAGRALLKTAFCYETYGW